MYDTHGCLFSLWVLTHPAASGVPAFTVQAASLLQHYSVHATNTERPFQKGDLLLVSLVVVTSIRNKSILYKYLFASRPSASAQESLSFRGIQKWCLWLNHSSRVSCSRNIDDGAIPFCARAFMLCGALVCSDILAKWYEIIRLEMIKVCDSCSSIARDNRRTIDLIREIVPWRNKYYSH